MTTAEVLDLLNAALSRIHRTLLQYVAECWPWTEQSETRTAIESAVQIQRRHVQALYQFLDQARATIDWGVYSTDFTDLHFVSLKYLLTQIVKNQMSLVNDLQRIVAALPPETPAAQLVRNILDEEQALVGIVQKLTTPTLTVTSGA